VIFGSISQVNSCHLLKEKTLFQALFIKIIIQSLVHFPFLFRSFEEDGQGVQVY